MKKDEVLEVLRNNESIDFDPDRFNHLVDEVGVFYRRAGALVLTEHGYSHTGIAKQLEVTDSTAKGYLDDLDDELGELVTQSKPKPKKYPELYPSEAEPQTTD